MNIIFKVDASHRMGTGHVMRCMTLADALSKKGHKVTFICRELPGNSIAVLKDKNFSVVSLPYNPKIQSLLEMLSEHEQWLGTSKEVDIQETLSYLSKTEKVDWLVVDHYGLDSWWETACRPYAKKIMVLDDLADRIHDCDILVNQNYYVDTADLYKNQVPSHCKKLIGPYYALLRPEFSEARKKSVSRDGVVQRLMVFLGGANYHNVTLKILSGIAHLNYPGLYVDVVLGVTSQYQDEIREFCAEKNYHFHCPARNMAEIMQNADLSIGAGGSTTWERCCLGLPSLVVAVASNQDGLIKQAVSANILEFLGNIAALDENRIAVRLQKSIFNLKKLEAMSQNGMSLVDGLGVGRVVDEILML
jgi:UDP-2,4-diacetamido-2,4,6-trideoxy-beta-L-altropyranose hydrolase